MNKYFRLIRYAKPYRGRIAVSIGCLIISSLLNAVSVASLQPAFDALAGGGGQRHVLSIPPALQSWLGGWLTWVQEFIQTRQVNVITFLAFFLFVVLVLKALVNYVSILLIRYVNEQVSADVREQLYAHLHTLSLGFFMKHNTGEIGVRVGNDGEAMGSAVTDIFRNAIREPFNIAGLVALLFVIHWKLALASFLIFPVTMIPIVKFAKKIRRRSTRVLEKRTQLGIVLHEGITGIRIVQAFGMEAYEVERFRAKNRELLQATMRISRTDSLSVPVMEIIEAIGVVGAVWLGGFLVTRGDLTPGALIGFLGGLASLYVPIKRLSAVNNNLQKAMAGANRVFETLDLKPEVADRPGAGTLAPVRETIDFDHVSFAYEPDRMVLRDIHFRAKMGEIVAIVGASGVGKSTLVNLLPRFFDPTEGRILFDGVDIREVTLRSLRSQIGMVTQESVLFDDTVANNIAYGRSDRTGEARIREVAALANADEFIRDMPKGYATRIGEKGVRLSGGQRQRLTIARALLKNPPILILDEATSALDAESERVVQEALERLMKNRTTFVIAHRLSTVMQADKIIVLEGGQVVEIGTHAELMGTHGAYSRLYKNQLQEV